MPVKTRHTEKVHNPRRFRTRPCNQSVVVLIDPTYHNVSLMSEVSFDDNFGAGTPSPRKTRKPRRPKAPQEKFIIDSIIEDDEDEVHDGGCIENNLENIPPDDAYGSDKSAIERMNAEETPETECTEITGFSSDQPMAHRSMEVVKQSSTSTLSVTPKSRISSIGVRRPKSNLLTASLFSIGEDHFYVTFKLLFLRLLRYAFSPYYHTEVEYIDGLLRSLRKFSEDSNTTPLTQPTQHDASFPSFNAIADINTPVMSSTPVTQKHAPQAHSTPFEQGHAEPQGDTIEKRESVQLYRALFIESSPAIKSLRPSITQDSFEDNDMHVLPPSPSIADDNGAIDADDAIPAHYDEDKLAALLDASMDLSPCPSEPNTSYNSLATLAEEVPFQTTLEIPFYLYGCPDATTATPLAKLLHVIGQAEVINWTQLPEDVFAHPKKLGEGTYGEVFATLYKGQPTALKVIPFVGDKVTYSGTVNGEYMMTAEAILPEVLIIRELSALYDPSADYSTPNFIQLLKTNVVQGHYPSSFLAAWDEFDEVRGSENDRPSEYTTKEQLFVTIGMAMGGVALEDYKMGTEDQAISALLQVALSLAVAEERLEFEHRDLHNGNVLIMETDADLEYKFGGGTMIVRSYGIKVSLIDFTLSRMSKEGTTIFRNLEDDEELFTGTNDYQFDIYRMMRDETDGNWASFKRKTNCLWLHYLSRYIIGKGFKKAIGKKRKRALQNIWDQLLNFESIRDIFTSDDFIELLETHLKVQPRSVS
ncbi:hypothetical protein OESDEN_05442 [Oesophagostomum dentatum]|uniref:non-specific serine/threonine protein kinase n=1 Tax=Oesophagostomum dentatum TaxID=61180 RepID=A0A0B1TFS3_OESDE|nr:hypothetical protein OESDEN_05442 [Oesophagostomum dentatum]